MSISFACSSVSARSEYYGRRQVRLVTFRPSRSGQPSVIWFPFGGGNALAFRECAAHLPTTWGAHAVDPPGHVRTDGKPLRSVDELASLYASVLPSGVLDGALLVGHSLGGYVALSLAAQLESRGRRVGGVVMAAVPAPENRRRHPVLSKMNAAELFDWIDGLGALAGRCEEKRQMFDLFENALRADIAAYETFRVLERPRAPMLVLAANEDTVCPVGDVRAWQAAFPLARFRIIEGGHLFVLSSPGTMAEELRRFAEVS